MGNKEIWTTERERRHWNGWICCVSHCLGKRLRCTYLLVRQKLCGAKRCSPPVAMAVSAWQALSPLQWARWGWDTLLGGAGDGNSPDSDPALGLLRRLSWGSRHDSMIRDAGEGVRQRWDRMGLWGCISSNGTWTRRAWELCFHLCTCV